MSVAIKIALWAILSFPLWLLFSAALIEEHLPLPRFFGAILSWVAAGFLLGWALSLFGHDLGLPWAFAHP